MDTGFCRRSAGVHGDLGSVFIILLVLGAPIYLTMGASSGLVFASEGSLVPLEQKISDELNSPTLLAVPYFVVYGVLADASICAAAIMIIIAMALAFGHLITEMGIAQKTLDFVKGLDIQPWQFLLAVNIILIILGMFLKVFSIFGSSPGRGAKIQEPHSNVGLFVLLRNSGGAPQKVDFFKGIVIVTNNQITFGYRTADRVTGITRATAKRLAD